MKLKKITNYIKSLSFYDTIKHGSVYTLAFAFTQLISVITLPIFTKLLLPSDFGIYEVFNNTVRVLGIVISLNLFNGFYRFYFEEHLNKQDLMQYLLRTSFIAFFICSIVLIVFRQPFMQLIQLPNHLFFWILIAVFSNIVFNFFNTYNTAQQLSKQSGIWQFVTQLLRVIVAILFIVYWKKNYEGRIIGEYIILSVLALVILFYYFRNYFGFKETIPATTKREIIHYSVSFIPIGLSGFVLGYLDTIMINNFKGSNDAGLYSYAYKFAIIYSGITTAFMTANRPKLFEFLNEKKEEEVIAQMRSMFKLVVALSSLFIFFAADGGRILALNDAFDAGLYLMPVLILSYIFNDINELYSFYFHYEKKVKYFYYSFAFSAVINFVLNLIYIPKYGYAAAAYTTLVSYGFMLMCTYIICKKVVVARVPAVIRFVDYLLIIAIVLTLNFLVTNYIYNLIFQIVTKGFLFIVVLVYLWRNIIRNLLFKQK